MAEVRLRGVSKRFGDTLALDDVSLTVPDGAFVMWPMQRGESVGLAFDERTLSVFDIKTGRALRSKANMHVLGDGAHG